MTLKCQYCPAEYETASALGGHMKAHKVKPKGYATGNSSKHSGQQSLGQSEAAPFVKGRVSTMVLDLDPRLGQFRFSFVDDLTSHLLAKTQ
jgi:hypothetical protein